MASFDEVANQLNNIIRSSEHAGKQRATTGRFNPATGKVETALNELPNVNQVWVRFSEYGAASPAWNLTKAVNRDEKDVWVWVKRDPNGELEISGLVNNAVNEAYGDRAVSALQPATTMTTASIVPKSTIDILRPVLMGGMIVNVSPYLSLYGNFNGADIDITSFRTSTVNKRAWVVVYLDTDDLLIKAIKGADTEPLAATPNRIRDVAIPASGIRVCAVSTYSTQTVITSAEFVDIREFLLLPGQEYAPLDGEYVIRVTDARLPNAQVLDDLPAGLLRNGTDGALSAALDTDIADTLGSQTTRRVYASPSASNGLPSFRALVVNDIPDLPTSKIQSGVLSTLRGGLGSNVLLGTSGQMLVRDGNNGPFIATNRITIPTAAQINMVGEVVIDTLGTSPLGSKISLSSPAASPGIILERGDGLGGVSSRWDVYTSNTQDFTVAPGTGAGQIFMGAKSNFSQGLASSGTIEVTNANAVRYVQGNYGAFVRMDGANWYHMITNSGDQYGSWNSLRPLTIAHATGNVSIGGSAITAIHNGNVAIGGSSPVTKLHVFGTFRATLASQLLSGAEIRPPPGVGQWSIVAGATLNTNDIVNATRKLTRIGMPHYTNAEENVSLLIADANAGYTRVLLGGGDNTGNAVTNIRLATAANTTTVAGTTRFEIDGNRIGFFGSTPIAKPTITGSRGGNAALTSLLTALANIGIITNGTT